MAGAAKYLAAYPEKGSRVLRKFLEERELERALAARARLDMKRNFAGGAVSRLTASLQAWSGSINADLDASLVALRARARHLAANHEYGRRFLTLAAANIVGPRGPTLQVRAYNVNGKTLDKPANDALEVHWQRWGRICDVRGQLTLPSMLRVCVKGVARDGEALIRKVANRSLPYGLQLQLLEADRLDESINRYLDNGNIVRMGVEFNSWLKPQALYIKAAHPGDNYQQRAAVVERVPIEQCYHVYVPERAEQGRGYTWFHAVVIRQAMLQGYEESAITAARVGASKVGFFKRAKGEASPLEQLADTKTAEGALQMDAEPGTFHELPPGVEFDTFDPDYPHQNFESFVVQCLRGLAAGLDVDYASLSSDRSRENFSSIRTGTLESREVWMLLQEWLIDALLVPLYQDWLASALLTGSITLLDSGKTLPADKYAKFREASRFRGRRWSWVDPLKDAQAAEKLLQLRLTTRTRLAAEQGVDFEDIVDELAQEEQMLKAAGLQSAPAQPAGAAQPGGGGQYDANPDPEDDEEGKQP
jgi:lambda family phage portal protein